MDSVTVSSVPAAASASPAPPAAVTVKPVAVESDSFDDMFGDDEEVKPAAKADVNAIFDEDEGDNDEEKAANRGIAFHEYSFMV